MKPLRILVSDDDADHARSLTELLALEGHRADAVDGGADAAKSLERAAFDIAFLGSVLRGKDAVESFIAIKRARPATRSYLLTGFSIGQLLRQAAGAGSLEIMDACPESSGLLSAIRRASPGGLILIAESSPGMGRHLVAQLNELDYEAAHVTDPATVLDVIEERRVHVLILDLGAPLIESAGVYRALDAAGRAKPTIILGTGLDDAARTGVITKPFDPKLLVTRLAQLAA